MAVCCNGNALISHPRSKADREGCSGDCGGLRRSMALIKTEYFNFGVLFLLAVWLRFIKGAVWGYSYSATPSVGFLFCLL